MNLRQRITLAVVLATACAGLVSGPAEAHRGDDVVRRGSCSGHAHWKLKAKHDDSRIEVEAEVDSDHSGQTWHWRLRHNGSLSAQGTRTTQPPSGSFEVHRRVVDLTGSDTLRFRARNPHSGEVCRGTVRG